MKIVLSSFQKKISIFIVLSFLFVFKLYINNYLMAENGDTYDFFEVALKLSEGNFFYESKRQPLFPLFLSPFNPDDYIFFGRVINNLFYFLTFIFFYKLIQQKFNISFLENTVFTLIFALNFIVFDNSFYILADTLFLFLVVLFFYAYEKNLAWYYLTSIGLLATYTRFEGVLLLIGLVVFYTINKKSTDMFKVILLTFFVSLPLLSRFGFTLMTGSSYLNDEVGFSLKFENILKALGSLFFATGGFWLLSFLISLKPRFDKKDYFNINWVRERSNNLYFLCFLLFSFLLILWGFFIRLYTPIVFFSLVLLVYLYKESKDFKFKIILSLIPFIFYILNVQILDHFDLGYFKFSKILTIVFSFLILIIISYSKFKSKSQLIIFSCLVIILNQSIFIEKFLFTREKYSTIVQASEFANDNGLKNVAYFDESGVQSWYFKDFDNQLKFYSKELTLDDWLKSNQVQYLMITEEMGYQIPAIDLYKDEIKKLELIKNFKSGYFGGETTIYKYQEGFIN